MLRRTVRGLLAGLLGALGIGIVASPNPVWAVGDTSACYDIFGTADTILTPTGQEGTLNIEGDLELEGTLVGTVVGQEPSGALLIDHVFTFTTGQMLTRGDVAYLQPTDDPCLFDVVERITNWSGTGEFQTLHHGDVTVVGTSNVCTGTNDLEFTGQLCFYGPPATSVPALGPLGTGLLAVLLVAVARRRMKTA